MLNPTMPTNAHNAQGRRTHIAPRGQGLESGCQQAVAIGELHPVTGAVATWTRAALPWRITQGGKRRPPTLSTSDGIPVAHQVFIVR